jgi:hypothetical protein
MGRQKEERTSFFKPCWYLLPLRLNLNSAPALSVLKSHSRLRFKSIFSHTSAYACFDGSFVEQERLAAAENSKGTETESGAKRPECRQQKIHIAFVVRLQLLQVLMLK